MISPNSTGKASSERANSRRVSTTGVAAPARCQRAARAAQAVRSARSSECTMATLGRGVFVGA